MITKEAIEKIPFIGIIIGILCIIEMCLTNTLKSTGDLLLGYCIFRLLSR